MMTRISSFIAAIPFSLAVVACSASTNSAAPTSPPNSTAAQRPAHHHANGPSVSPVPPQSPVPVESNPPGDIPDNTQFVAYSSTRGNFVVKVPEAWARSTTHGSVSFTDKLNTVAATWFPASQAPTASSAKAQDVHDLRHTVPAFRLGDVVVCSPSCTIPYSTAPISVTLPMAPAVVITYDSNSAPNSVTGKQYRDENIRFEFYKNREETALTLSGPVGSDNVDPWRLVSESFRWR